MSVSQTAATERVLLTDGETRAALASIRSLGEAGFEVHVVSRNGQSLGGNSRFAVSDHAVGDAMQTPHEWADALLSRADELGVHFILPLTEASLGSLYLSGCDQDERVVAPERAAYEASVDKHSLMQRALASGVDTPASVLIDDLRILSGPPEGIDYPAVLKPRRSLRLIDGRWQSAEVRIAYDESDWKSIRHDPSLANGCLVQEFVPGHGEAVFLLCDHGEPRVRFAHRRIREKPPSGGQSVLRESIEPDTKLLEWSERLLQDLDWNGLAMVEFRRAPDGRAVLMEINPRLWGSLQLAIDAGIDFPRLLLDLHRGQTIPMVKPRLGVRTRWLLGDLDHLLICLRSPKLRKRIGMSLPRILLDFMQSFFDGTRTEIWRRDDMRPFQRELREWFGEWFQR